MKVRITLIAENNKPRSTDISEDYLRKAYQVIFDLLVLSGDLDLSEKIIVEKAEFVDE